MSLITGMLSATAAFKRGLESGAVWMARGSKWGDGHAEHADAAEAADASGRLDEVAKDFARGGWRQCGAPLVVEGGNLQLAQIPRDCPGASREPVPCEVGTEGRAWDADYDDSFIVAGVLAKNGDFDAWNGGDRGVDEQLNLLGHVGQRIW